MVMEAQEVTIENELVVPTIVIEENKDNLTSNIQNHETKGDSIENVTVDIKTQQIDENELIAEATIIVESAQDIQNGETNNDSKDVTIDLMRQQTFVIEERTKDNLNDKQSDEIKDSLNESIIADVIEESKKNYLINDIQSLETKDSLDNESIIGDDTEQSFTEFVPQSNSTLIEDAVNTGDDTDDNSDIADDDSVLLKYDEIFNRHSQSLQLEEKVEENEVEEVAEDVDKIEGEVAEEEELNHDSSNFGSIDIKRKSEKQSNSDDKDKKEIGKFSLIRMIRSKCCTCM